MRVPRTADPENSYVPRDYEDLYNYYIKGEGNRSLAKSLLRSFLPFLQEDEREALLQDVVVRLIEHDMIGRYDPTKSNFGGMIFVTVRTIACNYLDRRGRNPITGLKRASIETNLQVEDFEPGTIHLDKIFSTAPAVSEHLMDRRKKLQQLFDYARQRFHKNESVRDRSLLTLLKLLLEENEPKDCAAPLGVTPSTVYNWIAHLRIVAASLEESN